MARPSVTSTASGGSTTAISSASITINDSGSSVTLFAHVGVFSISSGITVNKVTADPAGAGSSFTLVIASSNNWVESRNLEGAWWRLNNPSTGSLEVQSSAGSTHKAHGLSLILVSGVNSSTPIGASSGDTDGVTQSSAFDISLSFQESTSLGLWGVGGAGSSVSPYSSGTDMTILTNFTAGNGPSNQRGSFGAASFPNTSSGANTMSLFSAANSQWHGVAIEVLESTGAAAPAAVPQLSLLGVGT